MSGRALLAGLLGAVAMFVWSSLAHVVLPLGQIGVREIPHERPILDVLHSSLREASGFYIFPGLGVSPDASRSERNAAMSYYAEKLAASPSGILVYHPPGNQGITPGRLATELLTEPGRGAIDLDRPAPQWNSARRRGRRSFATKRARSPRRSLDRGEPCSAAPRFARSSWSLLDHRGIAPFTVKLAPSPWSRKFRGEGAKLTADLENPA